MAGDGEGAQGASASEHAKVLRDAYLIETRREGRSVRHSLTPLGRTMLGHLPHVAEEPRERAGWTPRPTGRRVRGGGATSRSVKK